MNNPLPDSSELLGVLFAAPYFCKDSDLARNGRKSLIVPLSSRMVGEFCTECVEGVSVYLFSDAVVLEDVVEDDFGVQEVRSQDGIDGRQGAAEVFGHQVRRDAAGEGSVAI